MGDSMPQVPYGFYWRLRGDWCGSQFTQIQLCRRRRFWRDEVVFSQYVTVALEFPEACRKNRAEAARMVWGVDSGRAEA